MLNKRRQKTLTELEEINSKWIKDAEYHKILSAIHDSIQDKINYGSLYFVDLHKQHHSSAHLVIAAFKKRSR